MKKLTQKKSKKILVFISNGLGEVEFIYPYLSLINTDNLDIKFLYLEKKIFQKANSDLLWSLLIKQKNFKTIFLNNNVDEISRTYFFEDIIKKFFIFIKLVSNILFTDILIIDYGQIRARFCNVARFFAILLNKKIIAMPHTSNADYLFNINEIPSIEDRRKLGYNSSRDKEVCMSLDPYSYSYNYYFLNFKKQVFVGNPRRNKKFLEFVSSINHKNTNYILYCSFYANKKLYSLQSKENHFINMYTLVRKYYPNYKILVTLHPREKQADIKNIILKYNCENVEISKLNTMLLSKNAELTIGTITSAMYCPLYFGKNSINYWEEDEKYHSYVGHSHALDYLEVKHAKNTNELEKLIQMHLNGESFNSKFFNPSHNKIRNIFNSSDGDVY